MYCFRPRTTILLLVVGGWMAAAAPASAQSSANERRWEIEGYGGLMLPTSTAEGSAFLPQPGPPIATSSPIFPSRRVPSWFFGDGASLLNLVNEQFDVPASIQPFDAALDGSGLAAGNGLAGGVRVRRTISSRFSVELSFDMFAAAAELPGELLSAVDGARDSFAPAFEGLLATGPFSDVTVEASSAAGGSAFEIAATGALIYHFSPAGGFAPYLTLGGGVIAGAGDAAAVTLEGRYRFEILGEVPIDETDRVTIRLENRTVLAGTVGAGLRRDVTDRWGVRVDGRVLIGPQTTRILIDADPVVAEGTPAGFVESFTAPSIQFSNNPSTGRESTLGGPPLQGFEAFVADGLQARILITAGLFVRF